MNTKCAFEPCDKIAFTKGLCKGHYKQRSRNKELRPLARRRLPSEDNLEWFMSMLVRNGDCLEWTGAADARGYGHLQWKRRRMEAHRLAYTLVHGEIPNGLVIDHICWNPPCCNPDHLRAVTQSENAQNRSPEGNSNNTSGTRGVLHRARYGEWYAVVKLNGENYTDGPFRHRADAEKASVKLRAELFTNYTEHCRVLYAGVTDERKGHD